MIKPNLGCVLNGHKYAKAKQSWWHYYHSCSQCEEKLKCTNDGYTLQVDCEGCVSARGPRPNVRPSPQPK
jgi:hypothetical protein